MEQRCQATRRDGQPCISTKLVDGQHCLGHAPYLAATRAEARQRGGRNRAQAVRLRRLTPPALVPVFEKLGIALDDVLTGKLDTKRATAAASVARAMAAILVAGELEERVRRLEQPKNEGAA